MIDFKKIMKDNGTKAILRKNLPKIPVLVSERCGQDECYVQEWLEFEVFTGEGNLKGEFWIRLLGGPTGYESANLIQLLERGAKEGPGAKWVACFGSDRYKRCEVRIDNIAHAVKSYNVNFTFEVL